MFRRRQRNKRKQSGGGGFNLMEPTIVLPALLNDSQVLTFPEWCALNRISKRTGRRILSAPGGPVVTRLSPRRFGITVANNRRWQQSRERAS
jgi:hypothetical protein